MPAVSRGSLPTRCARCKCRSDCPFARAGSRVLFAVQAVAELVRCTAGYTIFREGQPADTCYIVRSGVVKLTRVNRNGRKAVVGIVHRAGVLGVLEALTGAQYETNAETIEECELEQILKDQLVAIVKRNPLLTVELLRTVSAQLRKFQNDFYDTAGKLPSAERLMNLLRELGKNYGHPIEDGVRIRIPLPVQDLADKIGCSRQWTSKLLARLETACLIERTQGWITLVSDHPTAKPKASKKRTA